MYNTSIIDIIFFEIAIPVSMIPMIIPKGVIFNVCNIFVRNNIIAFKINSIQEYISEIEISDSDEITISKGTTEETLRDGSEHHLPNVNIFAKEILKQRKIREANLENDRS